MSRASESWQPGPTRSRQQAQRTAASPNLRPLLDERFTRRQWVGETFSLLAVSAVAVTAGRSADAGGEART